MITITALVGMTTIIMTTTMRMTIMATLGTQIGSSLSYFVVINPLIIKS